MSSLREMTVGIVFNDGEAISSINNLNKEMDKTGKGFSGLGKEGQDAFDKAGKSLDGFSKKTGKFGAAMTVGITAPITAIGTLAFNAAKDWESAFAGVRKTVDATEEEFAELEKGIRDM